MRLCRLPFPQNALAIVMIGIIGCGDSKSGIPAPFVEAPIRPAAPSADDSSADSADEMTAATSETYVAVPENNLQSVRQHPLSTFSIDVDTASYSNIRRFLQQRRLPPPDAVRIEECLNYFSYDDLPPAGEELFAVRAEVSDCPWQPEHRLARIGICAKRIAREHRPASNIVFLLDVSGSMQHPRKLPLLQQSMHMLVDQLGETDHVAIVVYAGAAGVVLPSTSATRKEAIHQAIQNLRAGGSTNGGLGIRLAYDIAIDNFLSDGVNRVILCTDGDFNVGITDQNQLTDFIRERARSGVFLSVLGFGMGNLKDATMEMLADRGNGHYAYLDSIAEAKKVLVDQISGALVTIAKDVKIQVEFNPAQVAAHRLIGYDNRRLANRDFKDDTRDAGEIGAGHHVTALYEIVPATLRQAIKPPVVDPLKYQPAIGIPSPPVQPTPTVAAAGTPGTPSCSSLQDELLTIKIRYKPARDFSSQQVELAVSDHGTALTEATADFRFSSAVAMFGLLLKRSPYRGHASFAQVRQLAEAAMGNRPHPERIEFLELINLADSLASDRSQFREPQGD